MYDYIIIGSGLFGCTFAHLAKKDKKKCLIIEKRNHPFGNCYTEQKHNIHVHKYGPHIFHTNTLKIWQFVNQFDKFNAYINRPKVNFNNKIFSFPINLMTLYQLWDVTTPQQAMDRLASVRVPCNNPQNLEEWILDQVGEEIYKTFIYGYTKKQWNTEPKNLPSFIIKRLPIRFNFDDNYYFDKYQGIPENGYSHIMQNMTDGIEIVLGTDYFHNRHYWDSLGKRVVYTGPLDEFFDLAFGPLQYRSLRFEEQTYNMNDFQGNAIINYTNYEVPYTRIIEHKHFNFSDKQDKTIITKEYPADYEETKEKYYPINNDNNNAIYDKYHKLSQNIENKYIFGGRLAEYRYYDMHQIIASAHHIYDKCQS